MYFYIFDFKRFILNWKFKRFVIDKERSLILSILFLVVTAGGQRIVLQKAGSNVAKLVSPLQLAQVKSAVKVPTLNMAAVSNPVQVSYLTV